MMAGPGTRKSKIRQLYRRLYKDKAKESASDRKYRSIFDKYHEYTMLPENEYLDNLRLIVGWLRNHDLYNGCIIECGTWRGGVSFGMVELLPKIQEFHCFDSFEGLPKAGPLDGELAQRLQREGQLVAVNNIATLEEFVAGLNLMNRQQREKVQINRGWFSETLKMFQPQRPISVLRIDCDWYDSVMTVLDCLFDMTQRNGLIVIDDYMRWDGCARAVHDFLSRRRARERIQQYSTGGVSFLVKDVPP
jgi:O-methyltransferase